MEKSEAEKLIEKYLRGECSGAEREMVESWYDGFMPDLHTPLSDGEWKQDMQSVISALERQTQPVRQISWQKIMVAASLLLAATVGGYFYQNQKEPIKQVAATNRATILPGGNKAVLTLQNGKKIILNSTHNGSIAVQGQAEIDKTSDGELVYTPGHAGDAETAYNTITTPRGGQYHLVLADGTNVWLNAASSLTYPATFTGKDRTVIMTGEAYFEVAHNPQKPFKVKSGSQEVEVLGTHFNINSYVDEPAVKTTLLQGSVRINGKRTLAPGQQSSLIGIRMEVYNADTEQATAWKDNKFMFDHENITGIMRMIARWYDVDISYSGEVTPEKFGGSVSRFTDVSKVLGILQQAGHVHFKVEGRRIIVSK